MKSALRTPRPSSTIRADVLIVAPGHSPVVVEAEAVLADQHNEWVVGRCYLTLAASAKVDALPEASLTQ